MQDRHGDGPPESRPGDRRGGCSGNDGPPGTDFLDLEISQVLYGEAAGVARDAFRELVKDAIKARLKERLGSRIEALAKIALPTTSRPTLPSRLSSMVASKLVVNAKTPSGVCSPEATRKNADVALGARCGKGDTKPQAFKFGKHV